jgi:hypothetical protein
VGAWGSKPFENDTALDFWAELRRTDDVASISEALRGALARSDEDFDVPDADLAIAAGELVAAGLGYEGTDLPDGALAWALGRRDAFNGEALELARQAVRRVHSFAPVLMESWFSQEAARRWLAIVEDLAERLELARSGPAATETRDLRDDR